MGYFSNGTEGMMYEEEYCNKCTNQEDGGCAIMDAHLFYNYDECNNDASILDFLIPRNKEGCFNEQCKLFKETDQ